MHVHLTTWIVVLCINFLYFCQLCATVGSGFLAQPITALLGGSESALWLNQVLNILNAALCPPVSQAADLWGRKPFLIVFSAFGFAGAMVVSRAQSFATVIVGFTIIGVNLGSQSILYAVVSEVLPRKHRPYAQASVNISAGLGAIVGLIMGGALLRNGDNGAYRTFFYVNAAIFAVGTVGCAVFYNPPERELQRSLTISQKLRSLDWIGYALSVPGLILFCIGLSWSNNPYSWSNGHIIGTFVTGITLAVIFCIYEKTFKKDGVLNHRLFNKRNFSLAALATFIEGVSFFTCNQYYVYEVMVFSKSDLLIAAMHFCILFFSGNVFCSLAAWYSARRKVLRLPMSVGFVALLIFYLLMATTTPSTPKNVLWGYPVIAAVGLGSLLPTIMVTAQLTAPPGLIALASGVVVASRSLGGTIGLAINGAIFNSAMTTEVPKKIAAATLPLGLPPGSLRPLIGALLAKDISALGGIPGVSGDIIHAAGAALTQAYSIAFRNCWIAAAAFCVAGVVLSAFVIDPPAEFTAHIDAPVEKEVEELQNARGHLKQGLAPLPTKPAAVEHSKSLD